MDQYSPIPADEQPLTQKNYSEINAALAGLNRARRLIDRAKAAGIDCSQHEMNCDFNEEMLSKLKATYFPHKP